MQKSEKEKEEEEEEEEEDEEIIYVSSSFHPSSLAPGRHPAFLCSLPSPWVVTPGRGPGGVSNRPGDGPI